MRGDGVIDNGTSNATKKWVLGMAFFRKYYSIFDLTPKNIRIGLVGGRMERVHVVDKEVYVLPDFYGLLFATIFVVALLCFICLAVCKVCCKTNDKKRFHSPLPVINKPKVIPASPIKAVVLSPVKEVYIQEQPHVYYEQET